MVPVTPTSRADSGNSSGTPHDSTEKEKEHRWARSHGMAAQCSHGMSLLRSCTKTAAWQLA